MAAVNLRIDAELLDLDEAEQRLESVAYAFTDGGRLLAAEPLDAKGGAQLRVDPGKEGRLVRVLVGPPADRETITAQELLRRGAFERHLAVRPGDKDLSTRVQIDRSDWLCWLRGRCTVRGTLLKRVVRDGVTMDLPVCDAQVEIYEVDPIAKIVPRLPDEVIDRIRDRIIKWPPPPPPDDIVVGPFPPDPPGPGPDPSPLRRVAHAEDAPAVARFAAGADESLLLAAETAPLSSFRAQLIAHGSIVKALLCSLYPQAVTTQHVASATTDDCGHFSARYFHGCDDPDRPDLYFTAGQEVAPGFALSLLEPTPVACHTHWNYVCGSEVTLYTSSPFARTCVPCGPYVGPDNWVGVLAIGNLSLASIRGASLGLTGSTTAANVGLTSSGAPFGELLRLRLVFDDALRADLGVQYYRVSWREGLSGAFKPLDRACVRHYKHKIGSAFVLDVFPLGPSTVPPPSGTPYLFEIPPALAPLGSWEISDIFEDTTNAKFVTTDAGPAASHHGKFQLRVELFDGGGSQVSPAAQNIHFGVPQEVDLTGTVHFTDAADAALNAWTGADVALNLIQGDAFVLTLHVDNIPCEASLLPPLIGGTAADGCGVLRYTPGQSVTMRYTGSHPHGFASRSFDVVRGVGPTVASASANPALAGVQTETAAVADLLAGGCAIAGFSERVHVTAKATNGLRDLSEYDADDHAAFALAPPDPPPGP